MIVSMQRVLEVVSKVVENPIFVCGNGLFPLKVFQNLKLHALLGIVKCVFWEKCYTNHWK